MIYLLYIILITHVISYNKMLIIYHMSSRETHLSNIHLNMTEICAYSPPTFCGSRDYYFQHYRNNICQGLFIHMYQKGNLEYGLIGL